jgi:hypothetical protein
MLQCIPWRPDAIDCPVISLDDPKPGRLAPPDGIAKVEFRYRPTGAGYRAQPPKIRATFMVASIYALLILSAWILVSGQNVASAHRTSRLVAIDISQNVPEPDAPAKPAIVPPVPETKIVALLSTKPPIEAAPPVAGSGTGNGCSVASEVGAAVLADNDAMAELAALPPEVRSDADAVMLWNGTWLDVDPEAKAQMASSPIPALKRVVTDAVLALPGECQEVLATGPQLIPIPEPGRTTMVVIGSGEWRWSDLIEPPADPDATGLTDQSASDWLASIGLSGN